MKLSYLLPAALLTLNLMSCQKDAPAPAAPAVSSATYAEGSAAAVSLALPASTFASAVANGPNNEPRRAVVLRATLPNGTAIALTYSFVGSTFPASGTVVLDVPVQIAPLNAAGQPGTAYQDWNSRSQLVVESASPQVVSGSYTGVLTAGGPAVKLTFTRLSL